MREDKGKWYHKVKPYLKPQPGRELVDLEGKPLLPEAYNILLDGEKRLTYLLDTFYLQNKFPHPYEAPHKVRVSAEEKRKRKKDTHWQREKK